MEDNNDNKNLNNLDTTVQLEPVVRESLVQTAVQFLQNPKTRSSSLKLKILFLKKKGLTEDEIKVAIDRSGAALYEEVNNNVASNLPQQPVYSSNYYHQMVPGVQQQHLISQPRSLLTLLRDIANTLVAFGGIGYFIYWLYKRFVAPWLFGKKDSPRRKSLPEQLADLDSSVAQVRQEVSAGLARIGADVEVLINQRTADVASLKQQNARDIQELSQQVASVKGLLLNRSQFPAVPPTTAASPVAASIPSWQLAAAELENKMEDDAQSNKSTNGGSDSSLEMISNSNNHDSV